MEKNKKLVLTHSNSIFFNSDNNTQKRANKKPKLSGCIFKENIINYQFSLETVMVRMKTIKDNQLNFGSKYNMIGDRGFFSILCFYGEVEYIDMVLAKCRIHSNNFSKSLHLNYPYELKIMYIRLKNKFGSRFDKCMRINIYSEIILREFVNLLKESKVKARKKLNKINFFHKKRIFLRLISYLPYRIIVKLLLIIKKV